jgi:hypothetical protein
MKLLIWILLPAFAFAHEAGEMSVRIGPDQGITEHSEEHGFKLGEKAVARFKLKFAPVVSAGSIQIPADAVVRALGEKGIYRKRNGFIKRVDITRQEVQNGTSVVTSADLKTGDEVLSHGTGFVRVIESAFGKDEADEHDGHSDEHEGHSDEHGDEAKGAHRD